MNSTRCVFSFCEWQAINKNDVANENTVIRRNNKTTKDCIEFVFRMHNILFLYFHYMMELQFAQTNCYCCPPFFLVWKKKQKQKLFPMQTELHYEWKKSIDIHVRCAEYMRLLFVKIKCPRAMWSNPYTNICVCLQYVLCILYNIILFCEWDKLLGWLAGFRLLFRFAVAVAWPWHDK